MSELTTTTTGYLVTAGGWCAPAEIVYQLVDVAYDPGVGGELDPDEPGAFDRQRAAVVDRLARALDVPPELLTSDVVEENDAEPRRERTQAEMIAEVAETLDRVDSALDDWEHWDDAATWSPNDRG